MLGMGQVTTVTISGVAYSIYGERDPDALTAQPSAGEYLNASVAAHTAWAALAADDQSRALVSATRYLDTLPWAGSKTSGAQPLQFPRTGLTRRDGSAVDSATVPDEVVFATYEAAYAVSQDPSVLDGVPGSSGNIKKVEGGPSSVEFFRPNTTAATVLAARVEALLAQFLAATNSTTGFAFVTGGETPSSFSSDAENVFNVGAP